MSKEEKVQLHTYISKKTDRRWREFVAQKNPVFLRGQFSYEVEMALIERMDKCPDGGGARVHIGTNARTLTTTHLQQDINRYKAEQLTESIMKWVKKEYNRPGYDTEIGYDILKKAIMVIKGVRQKRSVDAAIDGLKIYGLIKKIGDKEYAILHSIDLPPPSPPLAGEA